MLRPEFLPFHQPSIEDEEIQEVVDTLKSGWITTGPKTKLFEKKFQEYIGCKHAIAVSSCTAGLHLALVAAGVGQGDEVITTPYTFATTGEVIIQIGAKPVFVDIEEDGFNIDVTKIPEAITPETKAIIPIHFAGEPCDMDEIMKIAQENNLFVIEDAAHAVGAEYKGKKIGNIGDVTVFSFYATKNLTTGEGGMVTTNNDELAEKIRLLSLHGISKDAWKRYTAEGSWYYEILYAGYKYNMTDIQASLGIHQLNKLEKFLSIRQKYAQRYSSAFADVSEIKTPPVNHHVRHAWHLYVIRLNSASLSIDRKQFIEALKAENIGSSVHFIPLHLHPYYKKKYGYKQGDYPNSEQVYSRVISLPLFPKMADADLEDVIKAVKKVVSMYHS
ncbi:MAG: UDP-4-amino-4,6-dideoxy-N-acetyl-beta-L-altrosamine transaminase [Candidatus Marinimicrobia bacterium]|nr:UDP-4-amino-4,6-dideoxy-N-acetyl-beta-L-altrosamine transaminase [Candidatus Neomarinimicrobiota bacterium]